MMFLVAAVVLLLFSVGLSAMARHVPRPGAFFTYVGYGIGRPLGLGAAHLALMTYTLVQAAVYGYIGGALRSSIVELGGPSIPWWVWSLAVVGVTGLLGYRHIELSGRVLGILLAAEVGIVVALDVAVMIRGGDAGLSADSFTPDQFLSGSPGIGLMFAVAGFIGFEATAIFRDEARDPDRTIPRATYAAVVVIGVFYTVSSWCLVQAWGSARVVEVAAADPAGMIMTTARRYLGEWGGVTVHVLLLTSLFACVLSFHNVLTRYQHAMASATAMPGRFAAVHPTHGSPHVSSMVQTATAATLVVVFALCRLDPALQVSAWFSGAATLGIVALMALTCVAVVVYFRRSTVRPGVWQSVIAPVLGLVGLLAILVVVVTNFATLIGGSSTLAVILMLVVAATLVVGVVQARMIARRDPAAYRTLTDAIAR